jgi:hypothetical protein
MASDCNCLGRDTGQQQRSTQHVRRLSHIQGMWLVRERRRDSIQVTLPAQVGGQQAAPGLQQLLDRAATLRTAMLCYVQW